MLQVVHLVISAVARDEHHTYRHCFIYSFLSHFLFSFNHPPSVYLSIKILTSTIHRVRKRPGSENLCTHTHTHTHIYIYIYILDHLYVIVTMERYLTNSSNMSYECWFLLCAWGVSNTSTLALYGDECLTINHRWIWITDIFQPQFMMFYKTVELWNESATYHFQPLYFERLNAPSVITRLMVCWYIKM